MKKTGKILISALAVMLISIAVMFGAVSVSAVYEEQDTNMSVEQMAYDDYYDEGSGSVNMGRTIGTSLVVSIIGSVVAVLVVFGRYKFNGRTEPYPYTRKAPLELTDSEDVLVDQYVKTERIERR